MQNTEAPSQTPVLDLSEQEQVRREKLVKLKAAGVAVNFKNYDGVTHEFFGMAAVVPQAKDAQAYAVTALKNAFNK